MSDAGVPEPHAGVPEPHAGVPEPHAGVPEPEADVVVPEPEALVLALDTPTTELTPIPDVSTMFDVLVAPAEAPVAEVPVAVQAPVAEVPVAVQAPMVVEPSAAQPTRSDVNVTDGPGIEELFAGPRAAHARLAFNPVVDIAPAGDGSTATVPERAPASRDVDDLPHLPGLEPEFSDRQRMRSGAWLVAVTLLIGFVITTLLTIITVTGAITITHAVNSHSTSARSTPTTSTGSLAPPSTGTVPPPTSVTGANQQGSALAPS